MFAHVVVPAPTSSHAPSRHVKEFGQSVSLWQARTRFEQGLEQTVQWYRDNAWWWEPIRTGAYRDYYERQYGRALKS